MNYIKEFGNVYSRKVMAVDAMIKLDPFEQTSTQGLIATELKLLNNCDVFALYCGEGTINAL